MDTEIEVECLWPSSLENIGYEFSGPADKYRNAMVLPESVMTELEVADFGYVEVDPDPTSSQADSHIIHALRFESVPIEDRDLSRASLRTNLMDDVCTENEDCTVTVRKHEIDQVDGLSSYPGYSDSKGGYDNCYLSESVRDELDVSLDHFVEAFNPETGGRFPLRVKRLRSNEPEYKVRMSGQARNVLDLETKDPVSVRESVHARPARLSALEKLLHYLVGYRQLGLQVRPGLDRDEHRNVVRLSEDVMELMAVEPGDQIILEWNRTKTAVRCLKPVADDLDSMAIKVPSTVRDRLNVSNLDAIHVRRDMGYKLQQQVAVSTLGIIGVVIGSVQASRFLSLAPLETVALSVGLSMLVVWLLLLPERRRCSRGD